MAPKVLIVGAGPVGLVLALELAKYGVDFDIIDKCMERNSYSKALSVSAASLKIFQGLGLIQAFYDIGSRVSDIYVYWDGQRCCHIDKRRIGAPFGHYLSLPQPETERILEQRLNELGISIRFGCECFRVEPGNDEVIVDWVDMGDGKSVRHSYDRVVACDGAHSAVARMIGLEFEEHDYKHHFVIADVVLDKYPENHATTYYVRDSSFMIYLPMADGIVRLVASRAGSLPLGQQPPTIEEMQAAFDGHVPETARIVKMTWSSASRFFARVARTNTVGRVIFAGDSFHLFSPIGGQGMNTGLQDAFNLGWKLSWVTKGLARPILLTTYETERMAAVRKTFERVHHNTLRILQEKSVASSEDPYIPNFSKRSLYRNDIPLEFSGLSYNYSEDKNSPVGTHVPFIKIRQCDAPVATSYDLPQVGRYVVLARKISVINKLRAVCSAWKNIISIASVDGSIAELSLATEKTEVCVVRPDGYIGYIGDVQGFEKWLERHHDRQ